MQTRSKRNSIRSARYCAYIGACFFLLLAGVQSEACDVPVFRYALEHWKPDPYEILVLYTDNLKKEQNVLAYLASHCQYVSSPELQLETGGDAAANVHLRFKRLAGTATAPLDYHGTKIPSLPWLLVVRPPDSSRVKEIFWNAPLDSAEIQSIFHSLTRREIARRLISGESSVLVMLECGNKGKDKQASQLVRNELNALKKKFKLHSIENPYTPGKPLNLSFMRVSKSDPSEQFFIRTLARRQHKADNSETPAVYAVTGRGRAIKSFAGKKISKKNIEDLWYFLTGPCSCIIKAQNPGFDLLMSADWVSAIRGQGPVSALPSFEDIDIRGD